MKTKPYKPFIVTLLCLLCVSRLSAKICAGYIITHSQDTIYGDVRIRHVDFYKGGIVINGINLDPFYECLEFKAQNKSTFRYYYPKDISKYCFNYKSDIFHFKSFTLHPKSIFRRERSKQCYLALLIEGDISVYKALDRELIETRRSSTYLIEWSNTYYAYYIHSDSKGLNKLEKTEQYKNIKELLIFYGLEIEFTEKLPDSVDFKDIVKILIEYNNWKIKHLRSI